jgi:hypothetical protein
MWRTLRWSSSLTNVSPNDMDLEETNACSLRGRALNYHGTYIMKQVQHERTLLLVDLILNEFVLSHFDYFPLFLVSSPLFYAFTQAVGPPIV